MVWLVGTALAAPPDNDQPPALYLDEATVREHVHRHLPALAPCFADRALAAAELRLSLTLGPDGTATDPVLAPSDPAIEACLAAALPGLGFPRHHDEPVTVSTILVPRDGRLVPHPTVELAQRADSLLFVYVADPDAAAEIRADLRRVPAAE